MMGYKRVVAVYTPVTSNSAICCFSIWCCFQTGSFIERKSAFLLGAPLKHHSELLKPDIIKLGSEIYITGLSAPAGNIFCFE